MRQAPAVLDRRPTAWLEKLSAESSGQGVAGLVPVAGYDPSSMRPEEVAVLEKAAAYQAQFVFFVASRNDRPSVPQALVYVSEGPADDPAFAFMHRRLWSWGGVPLVYRKTAGLIQLFRCAHKPDFDGGREPKANPIATLELASQISADQAWWDATRLSNGTLWDDPAVCKMMLSAKESAHRKIVEAVEHLHEDIKKRNLLSPELRRRLIILSLLIAYLDEREALEEGYFGQFLNGAQRFFDILGNAQALNKLLIALEDRFNGNVFSLSQREREELLTSADLAPFARLVEGVEEPSGQSALWRLYSFKDLPVELISQIYQLFVSDTQTAVYTPPALVRLMLEEALSWERLDRLAERDEVVLDPACGSGVFLVESFKRMVLHWRSRNGWKRPGQAVLKSLMKRVHGIDQEQGAIELANFSLCLALCDALMPEEIRASVRLFPPLAGNSLHNKCFFEAKEQGLVAAKVGVVTGNPPFASTLGTAGAERSYRAYREGHGKLADKQLAYLFLYEAMRLLAEGGVASMIQPAGFLYNRHSEPFRQRFFGEWDVREVLDFVSVRGLFQKGDADPKVIVVVTLARPPMSGGRVLHAVFRRTGRADAEQGFDIDYYDLHWLKNTSQLGHSNRWRANLLGGGRVFGFLTRLSEYPTLGDHISHAQHVFGEGMIYGQQGIDSDADHVVGQPFLPADALSERGIDKSKITTVGRQPIVRPRRREIYEPPLLLLKKNENLSHSLWETGYIVYPSEIVGVSARSTEAEDLRRIVEWLGRNKVVLQAYVTGTGSRSLTQRSTAISSGDLVSLPFPEGGDLDVSPSEIVIAEDIVRYQRDLVRLGDQSLALRQSGHHALAAFSEAFVAPINAIYANNTLTSLPCQSWPGVICQPYVFGNRTLDWTGADELRDKLDALIKEQRSESLSITRIARIYDGDFIFLLKPDRLRFWLRSVALRDSDDVLADLRAQGF